MGCLRNCLRKLTHSLRKDLKFLLGRPAKHGGLFVRQDNALLGMVGALPNMVGLLLGMLGASPGIPSYMHTDHVNRFNMTWSKREKTPNCVNRNVDSDVNSKSLAPKSKNSVRTCDADIHHKNATTKTLSLAHACQGFRKTPSKRFVFLTHAVQ